MRTEPRDEAVDWKRLSEKWGPHIATAVAASTVTIGGMVIYKRFLKRFPASENVPAPLMARRGWIKGVVTSVGDADNFRLYHTPGPLLFWRFPLRLRRVPSIVKELQKQTIHIRLAGADAPEAAHFGRPKQPYSDEALVWLKSQVEGKRVHCQLIRRDQYGRIVANVHLPPKLLPSAVFKGKNVSYEMIKAGWATTYLQAGAEYGKVGKDAFLAAEARAKATRKGMWVRGVTAETPAEYKKRFRGAEAGTEDTKATLAEKPSVWSRFLPWRIR